MRDLWKSEEIYKFDDECNENIFSIDTPPPTVSGSLHIGHIFSYTQTDIIARYHRMMSKNVFYPMGYDDNGLATERYVEKIHDVFGPAMEREDFIELCLEETKKAHIVFEDLWGRMGLSVDWSKTYSTISKPVQKISQHSFLELCKKGFAYRNVEPSMYCTTCRMSIAQAELDTIEQPSVFNTIKFTVDDGSELLIATTRPELLPACVAIFYHPDDDRYKKLKSRKAKTPIFDREVEIIPDETVDPEKGTGVVMCCTFGDQTDVAWQKIHKLPIVNVVGLDGKWLSNAGPLEGLRVVNARKKTIELLEEANALVEQKKITHAVHVHERCKKPVEFAVLKQWFINVLDHKEPILAMADKIDWRPAFMKSRYRDWVTNLAWDWCISRQRFSGIPFPVWYCNDCGETLFAPQESLPIDPRATKFPGGKCKCGSSKISPENDVMDTWATSALTPQINAGWPEKKNIPMPMSMRAQAHDIIRTWAFYTIAMAYYHNNDIPWREISISGHALAGKGDKFSKSKGNAKIEPLELLKQCPADAIRYWSASGKLGMDVAFSEEQLKIGQRLITKLWNAFRFCKDHIQEKPKSSGELDELNKWILHRYRETMDGYLKYFKGYEYNQALEVAERFFWGDFCDNYLEMVKERLFNPENYDPKIIEGTRYTLYEVGLGILKLFAPMIPYITETLFQEFFAKHESEKSLHKTPFDPPRYESHCFDKEHSVMQLMVEIVGSVRKLKSENAISLKTPLTKLTVFSADKNLEAATSILKGVTNSEEIVFSDQSGTTAMTQDGETWSASVALGGE